MLGRNTRHLRRVLRPTQAALTSRRWDGTVGSEPEKHVINRFTNHFLNGHQARFTCELNAVEPSTLLSVPIYRVTDLNGDVIEADQDPNLEREHCIKMYKDMILLNTMDKILYDAQRQGRISFYMTNFGEEATHIGSAAALNDRDLIYGQYREAGVLMYRGFSLNEFVDSCYGNSGCSTSGRQMPVHYGSRRLHFVTISSPLSTQMPQAVGAAYAYKREENGLCVVCYFGDGAASEGDAHAAMNFAGTLKCPIIFFCRNNGYAISTPTSEQYAGDGIAARAVGYGIHTIRVDGNDLLAVYQATRRAREIAMTNRPVFIEAMTYRIGHHSTSDDSTAYRSIKEVQSWAESFDPIQRFRRYISTRGWWSKEDDEAWIKEARKQVMKAFAEGEQRQRGKIETMFDDVYAKQPQRLRQQLAEMQEHVARNAERFPTRSVHEQ